jgi:methionyl-tRNA formyltransferase
MDAGLDTGDILTQRATPIQPDDNAQTLHDRLAQLGAQLLVQTIPGFVAGDIQPRPQPGEGVSHAPKLKKEDGRIDWNLPARTIWHRIRAFTPWPGAFTFLPGQPPAQLLKVWEAEVVSESGSPAEILCADKSRLTIGCGQNALRILTLQREGGRRMTAAEFLAGHPLKAGEYFASIREPR